MSKADFNAPAGLGGEERLEESAADVASLIGAAASVGALGFSAVQAYYSRASYLLQRDMANEYEPGPGGQDEYDPGFADQGEYDPGFADQDGYDPGFAGQEYQPGFEDLDY
jgi:hypothetical protein